MFKNANSVYDKIKTNKQYPPENLFVNSNDWIKVVKKSIIVLEKTDKLKAYNQILLNKLHNHLSTKNLIYWLIT